MAKSNLLRQWRTRLSKRRLIFVAVALTTLAIAPDLIYLIYGKVTDYLTASRGVDLQGFKDTLSQLQMKGTEERVMYSLIGQFHSLMMKLNIEYVGHYGTLLGAARHAALIPWDDDVDFVIMKRNKPSMLRAIADQDILKLCYRNDDLYKLAFSNRSEKLDTECAWPTMDIFFAHEMGSQFRVVFHGITIYDKTSFFPSVILPFGPLNLRFPRCFHQIAIQDYGTEMCCTGSWNHRTDNWATQSVCIKCKQLQGHVPFANFTKLNDSTAKMVLRMKEKTIREEIVDMPTCERVSVQFIKPSSFRYLWSIFKDSIFT